MAEKITQLKGIWATSDELVINVIYLPIGFTLAGTDIGVFVATWEWPPAVKSYLCPDADPGNGLLFLKLNVGPVCDPAEAEPGFVIDIGSSVAEPPVVPASAKVVVPWMSLSSASVYIVNPVGTDVSSESLSHNKIESAGKGKPSSSITAFDVVPIFNNSNNDNYVTPVPVITKIDGLIQTTVQIPLPANVLFPVVASAA